MLFETGEYAIGPVLEIHLRSDKASLYKQVAETMAAII